MPSCRNVIIVISENKQRLKYVIGDFLTANLAWLCYNCSRYWMGNIIGGFQTLDNFLADSTIVLGQIILPLAMMAVYWLSGYYNEVFRKSRMNELVITFSNTCANTLIAFVVAIMNDMVNDNRAYNYETSLLLLALLFVFTYVMRAIITNNTSRKIKKRIWSFKTLIIGDGAMAHAFVNKLESMRQSLGYHVVGYVNIPGENRVKELSKPVYNLSDIEQVCDRESIKELIVVPSKFDSPAVLDAINRLFALGLPIKITPDKYRILLSRARLSDLYGDPLVDISGSNMSEGGKNVKRLFDVLISAVMLILLIPVFMVVSIIIKCDSRGSVFYCQERLGRHNRPFRIYKFRSMCTNAEAGKKPMLSSDNDPRITKVGKVLRKYRIDEIPQFWNVLKGDMSIVGPRPERQYYVQQILEREPAYSLIHQIRPGITSMGMVKFGYAKNVDEMIERLRYDLLYLENMSLVNDMKIIVYTFKIVFSGRGM